MKITNWGMVCVFSLVLGCTTTEIENDFINQDTHAFSNALKDPNKKNGTAQKEDGSPIGEIPPPAHGMLELPMSTLIKLNYAFEHGYQKVAEEADRANHYANGFLITTALSIALGELGSVSAGTIEKAVIFSLGINEGFKYANPPQVARAYRKAGLEALCFANTTVTQGFTKEGKEAIDESDNSIEHRVKLITAMRYSHYNLRERLTRSPVGFSGLLDSLKKGEVAALELEDKILVETKLAVELAKNKEDHYSVRLLSCLR
ncbi:MAG: hypothetical protein AB8B82_14085 [Roseovarius sp.]